jgi:hypothetical protein
MKQSGKNVGDWAADYHHNNLGRSSLSSQVKMDMISKET